MRIAGLKPFTKMYLVELKRKYFPCYIEKESQFVSQYIRIN